MKKIRDVSLRKRINGCLTLLATGFDDWRFLNAKKIEVGNPSKSIRSVRINDRIRIIFQGPIKDKGELCLFIHDVCAHDDYLWKIKSLAKGNQRQMKFSECEIELTDQEMLKEDKGLDSEISAFSKIIPARVLLTPDRVDAILKGDKANLLLTAIQQGILQADCPLLIHGQAGSGKTLVLCNRLALSVSEIKQLPYRSVFLTYNEKLVRQAERETDEILRLQLGYTGGLGCVDFKAMQEFLRERVPQSNKGRFIPENYVPYGRFKEFYDVYRRGNVVAKRVSCEVAWHGIRSILKGACVPPLIPPLSREKYDQLGKKKKRFS